MAIPSKKQPVKNTTPASPKKEPARNVAPIPSFAAAKQKRTDSAPRQLVKETPGQFPLSRRNFIFMIAAGLLIVIGFMLMLGGGTTTEEFNPDIFSTRRIVVGPTLAFLGFVAMGVAIIIRPTRKKAE